MRRRVLKAGIIHFGDLASAMDCTVRTLSRNGAGIDVSDAFGLPEEFNLAIRSDRLNMACRVVSRTDRHLQV